MAARFRERFAQNWPIKITALVLSAVLWAVVAAEEPTTEVIPVDLLVSPPEGRALSRQLPRVQALYSGSARELFKLRGQPPVLDLTIPDTVTGSLFTFDLSAADLITVEDAEVTAQEVQPRRVTVELDDEIERRVPAVARVSVSTDSGYALVRAPFLVPDSVTVRGPAERIRQIRAVATEPLTLPDIRGPLRTTVLVDTQALGVVRAIPVRLEVVVEVGAITDRQFFSVPVRVRADRAGPWESDPALVVVTVRGLTQRLARLTPDSVSATVSVSGATSPEAARVTVNPPRGLTAWAIPDTVVVRRRSP